MDKVKVIKFNGGGTLLYQNSKKNKATSVLVGFCVGSDDNTQNGIAHFTEHMLFKGTNKRSKEKLEADLRDYCGNNFNAYTGAHYTVFAFNRVNTLLDNAFELASDILLNSNISKRYVDNERSVILEEYNLSEDSSKYSIDMEHYNQIFNYKYSNRTSIGNKEDLDKITPKAIIEFKKKFYNRANFIVSVVGSESLSKIKRLIKKHFLDILPIDENCTRLEHCPSVIEDSSYQIVKKETDNVLVDISLKCVGFSDELRGTIVRFYNDYFSGGVDGKLFKAVRDKGLAYNIYTSRDLCKDNGIFTISFESSKENVNKVIDEIGRVIGEVRKNGIDESEIEKTKMNFVYFLSEMDNTNLRNALNNLDKFVVGKSYYDDVFVNKLLNTSKEIIDEYFDDLFHINTPIYVTIGGKVKQSEVYDLQTIKSKLLK